MKRPLNIKSTLKNHLCFFAQTPPPPQETKGEILSIQGPMQDSQHKKYFRPPLNHWEVKNCNVCLD